MIKGFIGSLITEVSNPMMAYLTGSTTSEVSSGTKGNTETIKMVMGKY